MFFLLVHFPRATFPAFIPIHFAFIHFWLDSHYDTHKAFKGKVHRDVYTRFVYLHEKCYEIVHTRSSQEQGRKEKNKVSMAISNWSKPTRWRMNEVGANYFPPHFSSFVQPSLFFSFVNYLPFLSSSVSLSLLMA